METSRPSAHLCPALSGLCPLRRAARGSVPWSGQPCEVPRGLPRTDLLGSSSCSSSGKSAPARACWPARCGHRAPSRTLASEGWPAFGAQCANKAVVCTAQSAHRVRDDPTAAPSSTFGKRELGFFSLLPRCCPTPRPHPTGHLSSRETSGPGETQPRDPEGSVMSPDRSWLSPAPSSVFWR